VAPTYMSRVTRMLAWPAMQETSARSRCQLDTAVVRTRAAGCASQPGPLVRPVIERGRADHRPEGSC